MADLQSRIGPKQEEQPFFRNKTWKRPGLHTPNKTATAVWDTSDTTNEGDSDSGSGNFNDDQYFISSPPPLSFSNSASPDRPSLQDRLMDGPILPGLIHQSPETEQLKNASKPLIDRVAIHDDNAERGFHDIRDGGEMDIDQDNDDVISSGSIDKSQNLKNVGTSDPNQPRIASLTSASETRNQTSSNNAGFGSQQKRNSSQLTLAQRMQNGYAPPRPNYSNTHTSPSKFNFNNNLEMNNVMPHERSGGSNSAQEDGHQSPLSSDPIRTIMMPVVQQNADCRANNDDSKNGPPQQKTVNPKVFTNEISASFSELGRKVHKDMQDRDLPRRSPPRVDPRNGSTIASTSTQERVEAPLYSPGTAHAYNQKAYNQHVNSAPYAPSMPSATSTTSQTEETRKVSQRSAPYHHQETFQRHTPDSQDSRDQDYERRHPSDSRYGGRRLSRSPPRTIPDKTIERHPPDHEFDNTRSRYDEQRYRRSPGHKSRSDSRDHAPYGGRGRARGRGRGRGDGYTHTRRFSRDYDYYRLPPPPSSYRQRSRSRSPVRRGPRTPPPREPNLYSRGRSPRPRTPPPYRPHPRSAQPPRRASRSPPRSESYLSSRTRSPLGRGGPRTPPPRRSSITSRISPMRPRSNERIQTRDHSVPMSVSSMHSAAPSSNSRFSNEPIPQPESTEMNQTTRDPEKSPSPVPEIIEEQETAEPQPPRPVLPCHNVPGLWFVKLALDNMGTLNCDFQIDQETALKWNIGQTNNEDAVITDFHSVQVPRKRLSLQICSFSKQLVQGVIETLGTDQTPATIASAIFGLEQKWPNQGQLIVKINPDTANTKTWLPNRLGLNNAPVQIEDFVQEGQNVVQFIQLSGMSDNLFALCASERND